MPNLISKALSPLHQAEFLEWTAIGYPYSARTRSQLDGAGRFLQRVVQIDRLCMLAQCRDDLLRDQPHAGLPVLIAHWSLHAEYYDRAGTQHAKDALKLRGHLA